ncbi:hypothetical protein [Caulobacter sp. NIBR1757]|uniref:hypothetical protein n=1 Tax=Caulobacter sp. NIBR1757 TaxID=3016000 RepID=UPI0022F0E6F4|nr:hypothetical protein [Caulobacter sp. NIBR1757]WGM39522.1 hypothetical protein AMEJIAPC_02446 [Caulobacter sp. NIBR1757]
MARDDEPAPVGQMGEDGSSWSKTIWIPTIDEADIELMPDEEGMSKQMAIRKRAIDAGQANLPNGKDQHLDDTQMQLCKNIFEGILRLNEFLAEQLGKAVKRATAALVHVAEVKRVRADIDKELRAALENQRSHLRQLRLKDLQAERDLRAFARRNGLLRAAHYKDSLLLPVAILVTMFVVESLINGVVLAQVSEQGVLGGVVMAGLISAFNIGTGILAGLWGWRNLFHIEPIRRVLGGVLTFAFHALAVVGNIFVAHYREAAELMVGESTGALNIARLGQDAVQHLLLAGPFGMTSLPAWALLIVGLVIHAWASKEGFEDFADPYPAYRKHDRTARAAAAAYEDALEDLRDEARHGIESIEQEAETTARRAAAAERAVRELKNLAMQRHQEILNSEDAWVTAGNRLLKMYRDENVAIRGPGPAYFDVFPDAAAYRTGTFGAGLRRSADVETQENLVKRHMDDLDVLIAEARERAEAAEALSKEAHRHASIQIRGLGKLIDAEDESVTKAAERQMNDPTRDRSDQSGDDAAENSGAEGSAGRARRNWSEDGPQNTRLQ